MKQQFKMRMNPMNLLLQLLLLPLVSSLPQTITVNHNSKECLYDLIEEGEKVTVSIFILSGAELKGGLLLEGPLSPDNITSGRELQAMIDLHDHHKTGRSFQKIEEDINFERILPGSSEEEAFINQDDEEQGDDDENLWKQMDDDKLTEEEIQRRTTERKRHAQIARKRALEVRRKRAEDTHGQIKGMVSGMCQGKLVSDYCRVGNAKRIGSRRCGFTHWTCSYSC